MMGSRTKNTPSKATSAKRIKDLENRMESNEINFFHGALRAESTINLLLAKGVITQEELEKEITKLVHIAQNIPVEEQLTEVEVSNKDKRDNVDFPESIGIGLETPVEVEPEVHTLFLTP